MNQSQRLWFEILDKQVKQLKKLGGHDLTVHLDPTIATELPDTPTKKPTLALGLVFNNLVTHLKIGWFLFQDASKSNPSALDNLFAGKIPTHITTSAEAHADIKRRVEEADEIERIVNSKNDDEYRPWWDRKTKHIEFANHACNLIRKIGKQHHLRILPVQSLQDHFKAFLKITSLKDPKGRQRTFAGPDLEVMFTLAIEDALEADLVKIWGAKGGKARSRRSTLSHLLADLEKKLVEAE